MLKAGAKVPGFTLQNEQGQDVSLSDLLEKGPVILYFYPADFSPVCTREACSIRDIHDDIVAVGLQIAGVSPQDPASHARFRDKHNLPFTLLCDPDKAVAKMFDVEGRFGISVRRATFLINTDGMIEDAILADILVSQHKSFIERAVALRERAGTDSAED